MTPTAHRCPSPVARFPFPVSCFPFPLALALLAALSGCRERPRPLASCLDPLGGTWPVAAHGSDQRYHLLDHGRSVEVFPMWDTSRPPDGAKPVLPASPAHPQEDAPIYSPVRIELRERSAAGVAGSASFRVRRGDVTCTVSWPARVRGCAGDSITLGLRPLGDIDMATCQATPSGEWADVLLVRE